MIWMQHISRVYFFAVFLTFCRIKFVCIAVVLYDTVHDVDDVFDLFLNASSILNLCQKYK